MAVDDDLPVEGYLTALAAIPRMGPNGLAKALRDHGAPAAAWAAHRGDWGAPLDPEALWQRHLDAGITVVARSSAAHDPPAAGSGAAPPVVAGPAYPALLADDPEPPEILFCRGDLAALDARRIAIVGTRRASAYGRAVARRFGRRVADRGVAVVSGLALGIDGEAHAGALASTAAAPGPPIGVVATGLDVPYPRSHRRLWDEVAERGLLLSESPLGTRGDRWRFPARNRIIAAVAEVVVVVESKQAGGSLYTAEEALNRERPLLAVPGPIDSPVAKGTNRLIADGAQPVCDDDDLFLALGLVSPTDVPTAPPEPGGAPGRVLGALGTVAATLEDLAARTGLPLPELAVAVDRLCQEGWLADVDGAYERTTPVGRNEAPGQSSPASFRA